MLYSVAHREASPLELYGHNLTALAKQGAFSSYAGQEAVVARMFQILLRERKRNPMLLHEDQNRRWEAVVEMVCQMAQGNAPDPLPACQVFVLDYEALFRDFSGEPLSSQKQRNQGRSALVEGSVVNENESDEEWLERVSEQPLWPALDEWVAPTVVLERLQAMFVEMHRAAEPSLLFADHFHRLLGGDAKY